MYEHVEDIIKSIAYPHFEIYCFLAEHIPNEQDLIAICENCIKYIHEFIPYQIETDYDIIAKCIESYYIHDYDEDYVYLKESQKIDHVKHMEKMIKTILELIMYGYKTEKPFELCDFGLHVKSMNMLKYQFDELTSEDKSRLLSLAVNEKFIPAIRFMRNQGVEYTGNDDKLTPLMENLLTPGRFTKSAA